ncbi:MAG TPA: hypothetical protein VE153_34820 [Myxococcus sp.]|nr:hypothetical protein [Myxococcus sp.]
MLRKCVLLGFVWAGCSGGEVGTYRIAPHLQPGTGNCIECGIGLVMTAVPDGSGGSYRRHFYRDDFVKGGFTFKWGMEQVVELEEEHYDSWGAQDDIGVRYHFVRLLESHPVEPDSRFEMRFDEAPPGHYPDDFLVRTEAGFELEGRERIQCETQALCDQLASLSPGEDAFGLGLSYPASEGGPLLLHSLRSLP